MPEGSEHSRPGRQQQEHRRGQGEALQTYTVSPEASPIPLYNSSNPTSNLLVADVIVVSVGAVASASLVS